MASHHDGSDPGFAHDEAHVHLYGRPVDRPGWGVSPTFDADDFDAVAMERAMRAARRRAYASLADLDAA